MAWLEVWINKQGKSFTFIGSLYKYFGVHFLSFFTWLSLSYVHILRGLEKRVKGHEIIEGQESSLDFKIQLCKLRVKL